jgi:hypothetical protein
MADADPQIKQCQATTRKDFDAGRSQLLDSFARLESIASELLCCTGSKAPFSQKLVSLSTILEPDLIDEARQLSEVRNDIVHSVFRMIPGSTAYAVYLNTTETNSPYPQARMLTIRQHKQLARDVKALADLLQKKLPQSSTLRD